MKPQKHQRASSVVNAFLLEFFHILDLHIRSRWQSKAVTVDRSPWAAHLASQTPRRRCYIPMSILDMKLACLDLIEAISTVNEPFEPEALMTVEDCLNENRTRATRLGRWTREWLAQYR